MGSDYRRFICLDHPLVSEIFGEPEREPEQALSRALERLRTRCVYRSAVPGHISFDELLGQWRSRPPAARLELNCINLTCLLVSHLRRGPFAMDEALVVLGAKRGMPGAHAWVLLRNSPLRWIDPKDLTAVETTGQALMDTYHLYVIFNDRRFLFHEADKVGFLSDRAEQAT